MRSSAAWRGPALGALSGALYFLAWPPYHVAPLAWVALAPVILAAYLARDGWDALRTAMAIGVGASVGGYFWLAGMAHRFWQVNWVFALLLLLVFAVFAELHFTVFAWLLWRWRGRFAALPAACTAALYVLCERFVPRVFPDKLGHTQIDAGAFPVAAALVGTHGLSFVMSWVSAGVARAIPSWRSPEARRRATAELLAALAVACALTAYGVRRHLALVHTPPAQVIDVAAVQANIGDPEEIAHARNSVTQAIDSTLTTYIALSRAAIGSRPPDLFVWPETAVPTVPRPRIVERLQRFVAEAGTGLLFGAYDIQRGADTRWRTYNSAFYMDPEGKMHEPYAKHKLLLFGEYVPLSDRFPSLLNLLPSPGQFSRGPGPRVETVSGVRLTPLICYELLFPDVVRAALRAGGTLIVNLTNDYWFGRSMEPAQHLAQCRMCALETGRPIVRATNTGISAFIDAGGGLLAYTDIGEQTVLRMRIAVPPMDWTPYVRYGDAATGALVLAGCLVGALARGRAPRPKPEPEPAPAGSGSETTTPTVVE